MSKFSIVAFALLAVLMPGMGNAQCTGFYNFFETNAFLSSRSVPIGPGANRLIGINGNHTVTSNSSNEYQLKYTGSGGYWVDHLDGTITIYTYDNAYNLQKGQDKFFGFKDSPKFIGEVVINVDFSEGCQKPTAKLRVFACSLGDPYASTAPQPAPNGGSCAVDPSGYESDLVGQRLGPLKKGIR